jgi:RHS repeat-associated protein
LSDAFRYDAYGRTIGKTTSSLPTPWRFQGRMQLSTDDGSGNSADLYDFAARAYDPSLGVFTSFDDVAGGAQNPITLNRFLYAAANPATLIDPDGHCPFCLTALIGGVLGAVIGGGLDLLSQAASGQPIDLSELVTATAAGAVGGAVFGAVALTGCIMCAGAAAGAASNATTQVINIARGQQQGFDAGSLVTDTLVGGVSAGVLSKAASLAKPALASARAAIETAVTRLTPAEGGGGGGLLSRLGDAVNGLRTRISAVGGSCANSFAANTFVATAAGLVAIGTLSVGDKVLAWNPDTDSIGLYPITAVHVNDDPITGTVVIDGETIHTTPEHPFWTTETGWTNAQDLAVGMHTRSADGTSGLVGSVDFSGGPATMYNLTVDVAHTFFVGEGEWLVHNCADTPKPDFLVTSGGTAVPATRTAVETSLDRAGFVSRPSVPWRPGLGTPEGGTVFTNPRTGEQIRVMHGPSPNGPRVSLHGPGPRAPVRPFPRVLPSNPTRAQWLEATHVRLIE